MALERSREDLLAEKLRGFGPLGLVSFLVILAGNALFLPLSGILVLAWARLSRTPWRELGFWRPVRWAATVVIGIVSGVAFKFLIKAAVMPVLGADLEQVEVRSPQDRRALLGRGERDRLDHLDLERLDDRLHDAPPPPFGSVRSPPRSVTLFSGLFPAFYYRKVDAATSGRSYRVGAHFRRDLAAQRTPRRRAG